jgi:hypothetical protein
MRSRAASTLRDAAAGDEHPGDDRLRFAKRWFCMVIIVRTAPKPSAESMAMSCRADCPPSWWN